MPLASRRAARNILQQQALILHALKVVKPASAVLRFGHWEVKDKLVRPRPIPSSVPRTPLPAARPGSGLSGRPLSARSRTPGAGQPHCECLPRTFQTTLHPNIVAARGFFPTDDDKSFILILDDAPGQR